MTVRTSTKERRKNGSPVPDGATGLHRLPPQNLVAEQSVLGGLMLHAPAFDDVSDVLRPEDFYADAHRVVFSTIRDMHLAGMTQIDAVTVAQQLEKRGEFEAAGGMPGLLALLESVPHAAHTGYYAKIVRDKSRRRTAINFGLRVAEQAFDQSVETDDLLAEAEKALHETVDDGHVAGPEHIGDILATAMAALSSGTAVNPPVPTMFLEVDELAGGFNGGCLTILGARPSSGKTSLLCQSAIRMAEAGNGVLFSTWEQPIIEMSMRLLSIYCQIPYTRIKKGFTTPDENQRIVLGAEMLAKLPIYLDASQPDIVRYQSLVRRQIRKHGIKVAIADYLQLIEPEDRRAPREQQVAGMSRSLKNLALSTGIAMVAASQLNRDVEKRQTKRPTLADLRESGAIEQDADLVMLLWRPNLGNTGVVAAPEDDAIGPDDHGELVIAKQRNGPTGVVRLQWYGPTMTYRDQPTTNELVMDFE